MIDYRACNTARLRELIRMDPLCDAYRLRYHDRDGNPSLDESGQHLFIMLLPFVSVQSSRDISVHRVEVNAKLTGTMKPYRFPIDIPSKHWDTLTKLKFPSEEE